MLDAYEPDTAFGLGIAYEVSYKLAKLGFELPETSGEMDERYGELADRLMLD